MKKTLFLLVCLCIAFTSSAQLKVDSTGHVSVASTFSISKPRLIVGDSWFNSTGSSVGVSATPEVKNNCYNVGAVGCVTANQSFTTDKNYGVYGVCDVNNSHGRNYGVTGMLSFSPGNSPYGGAGIYAADYAYMFTSPNNIQGIYALYTYGPTHISGQMTAQEIYTPADERLSEDVEAIEMQNRSEGQTIDNLLKMNVLEFSLKNHEGVKVPENMDVITEDDRLAYEYLKNREDKMYSRRHFGLSAQELQAIYPNLVLEGQDGYLYVNYTELVPILIRSIQELKAELDEVKGENDAMKARSTALEDNETTGIGDATSIPAAASLAQNTPNPFSERTSIRFTLPENARNAYIYIFDMSGKMYKQIPVDCSMQSVTIEGYELRAGMYIYSLVIGGKEVQTRRMILSK